MVPVRRGLPGLGPQSFRPAGCPPAPFFHHLGPQNQTMEGPHPSGGPPPRVGAPRPSPTGSRGGLSGASADRGPLRLVQADFSVPFRENLPPQLEAPDRDPDPSEAFHGTFEKGPLGAPHGASRGGAPNEGAPPAAYHGEAHHAPSCGIDLLCPDPDPDPCCGFLVCWALHEEMREDRAPQVSPYPYPYPDPDLFCSSLCLVPCLCLCPCPCLSRGTGAQGAPHGGGGAPEDHGLAPTSSRV